MKTVWSISGGGTKIFWEAGVLSALLRSGVKPDALVGTSAGAILAGFVSASLASQTPRATADALEEMLLGSVAYDPGMFMTKRGKLDLAWRFATGRWAGLYDTRRLEAVVRVAIPTRALMQSAIPAYVGVTSRTGQFNLLCLQNLADPAQAIRASTAIPILMPGVEVYGEGLCFDGGLREIAPVTVDFLGADHLLAVVSQPKHRWNALRRPGSLSELVGWTLSNLTSEVLNGDLAGIQAVNEAIDRGMNGKKKLQTDIIRPDEPVEIGWDYSPDDAKDIWEKGWEAGTAWLEGR